MALPVTGRVCSTGEDRRPTPWIGIRGCFKHSNRQHAPAGHPSSYHRCCRVEPPSQRFVSATYPLLTGTNQGLTDYYVVERLSVGIPTKCALWRMPTSGRGSYFPVFGDHISDRDHTGHWQTSGGCFRFSTVPLVVSSTISTQECQGGKTKEGGTLVHVTFSGRIHVPLEERNPTAMFFSRSYFCCPHHSQT